MIMMVKRKERNLSAKALYRLEQAEREVVERKSSAERVVQGLLGDEGSAVELIERESRKLTKLTFKVDYSNARASKSLPREVTLWKPSEEGCSKLRQLFAQTMDTVVVLLACLHDSLRSERYLSQLTAESRIRMTSGALNFVIPDWRSLAAGEAANTKQTK